MTRRRYQQGYVFQKGRKREDEWLPETPAYVQYWRDVPGMPQRRAVIALGMCRTRTIAERAASERLEQLGINSRQHFVETTSTLTFKQQGERWLQSLKTRKRDPIEPTTIYNRQHVLDKWAYPFFGARRLAEVTNRTMREFVDYLTVTLGPATVREYVNVAKWVVASAIDENGEEIFPRKWNGEYIDAPRIGEQRQPATDSDGMEKIIANAEGQHQMLYALLAGSGLRIGEALGLEIRHIYPDFRTLKVEQKVSRDAIQPYLKTKNGKREVDLCTSLAAMLAAYIGDRHEGLLFQSRNKTTLAQSNILVKGLHPILHKLCIEKGGFNIFRRYRITHLFKSDCPRPLEYFWNGHAQEHVSEKYTKLLSDRAFRLEQAERIGLGITLPTGQPGLPQTVRRIA